jgi:hypothetical protein
MGYIMVSPFLISANERNPDLERASSRAGGSGQQTAATENLSFRLKNGIQGCVLQDLKGARRSSLITRSHITSMQISWPGQQSSLNIPELLPSFLAHPQSIRWH